MTNGDQDKVAAAFMTIGVGAMLGGFGAFMYLVSQSGFEIAPTPERKVVTVYCLGEKVKPVYCKNLDVLYNEFTNNEGEIL